MTDSRLVEPDPPPTLGAVLVLLAILAALGALLLMDTESAVEPLGTGSSGYEGRPR